MFESQSLEMIPPIPGREKILGWYPPAHSQYVKVPYKTMAVLDDYNAFRPATVPTSHSYVVTKCDLPATAEKPDADKPSKYPTMSADTDGSVLSNKLNSIRQELSRKQINVRKIQKTNFNSVKEYLNIPEDWSPKYPEPNFEIKTKIIEKPNIEEFIKPTNNIEINTNISRPNSSQIIHYNDNGLTRSRTTLNVKEIDLNKNQEKKTFKGRPQTAPSNYEIQVKPTTQSRIASAKPSSRNRNISSATSCSNNNTNPVNPQHLFHDNQLPNSMIKKCHSEINLNSRITKLDPNYSRRTSFTSKVPKTNYEKDLQKYQWLMEVEGDPFQLKKPHLPSPIPYTYPIPESVILPQQPTMEKQNRDTFFYNTIPYNAASFEIHPKFTSERYNATKNKLKSQGKWNFSYKNFSFVY